ncbi:hypothetical protein CPB83DRAFT_841546 [Crepidotus variabilis]|uniref:Uncharacterized protein n=1 Tax=Crepidotus variabilis TaxID=179855 RepID=A0A9P6JVD6_9AGAR|nr:hypothetical protein CPB83DRAFT_841546 [Crepidotus variabilis]
MPAERSTKNATHQLTLTGKPAPVAKVSSSSKTSSPDRVYTDAILAIRPEFVKLIASREKNHEYRAYKMRDTVERIWLYETAPGSSIAYIMETGKPKTPGQVNDSTGVGNDDFDKGLKKSKFGYPVKGLYKLKAPLKPDVLKAKFSISPPQGLVYVTKPLFEAFSLDEMEKVF